MSSQTKANAGNSEIKVCIPLSYKALDPKGNTELRQIPQLQTKSYFLELPSFILSEKQMGRMMGWEEELK